jgi:hypothetical protein
MSTRTAARMAPAGYDTHSPTLAVLGWPLLTWPCRPKVANGRKVRSCADVRMWSCLRSRAPPGSTARSRRSRRGRRCHDLPAGLGHHHHHRRRGSPECGHHPVHRAGRLARHGAGADRRAEHHSDPPRRAGRGRIGADPGARPQRPAQPPQGRLPRRSSEPHQDQRHGVDYAHTARHPLDRHDHARLGSRRHDSTTAARRTGWPERVSRVRQNKVSATQFPCLDALWTKESGWQATARNPDSTAYGIPQLLDSTWAATGIAITSNGYRQVDVGLAYISAAYGTPCSAWAHSQATNWY